MIFLSFFLCVCGGGGTEHLKRESHLQNWCETRKRFLCEGAGVIFPGTSSLPAQDPPLHLRSTDQDAEGDAEREDVGPEVVRLVREHLGRVVPVRAQDVLRHDLLRKHALAHAEVDHFELELVNLSSEISCDLKTRNDANLETCN